MNSESVSASIEKDLKDLVLCIPIFELYFYCV